MIFVEYKIPWKKAIYKRKVLKETRYLLLKNGTDILDKNVEFND